jgi:hypothetical protein
MARMMPALRPASIAFLRLKNAKCQKGTIEVPKRHKRVVVLLAPALENSL